MKKSIASLNFSGQPAFQIERYTRDYSRQLIKRYLKYKKFLIKKKLVLK